MADPNTIYSKNPDVVSRKIEGETILVPIFSSEEDVDSIYMLNDVAGFIWDQLDGKTDISKIIEAITQEYHVSPNKASKDISSFLGQMAKIGTVV